MEHLFRKLEGVLEVTCGYMGGTTVQPSYQEVCSHNTGHYETVEVCYDDHVINYPSVAQYFFEIHDPTQKDGQGPDIGEQYQSVLWYQTEEELATAQELIRRLEQKGLDIATKTRPVATFYKAEEYHQKHYLKRGSEPYCHIHTKRF